MDDEFDLIRCLLPELASRRVSLVWELGLGAASIGTLSSIAISVCSVYLSPT